jgi:YfiR/HmsC-like
MTKLASEVHNLCSRGIAFRRPNPLSALLAFVIFSSISVWSQSHRPTEYDVKAAYLYNFGKFVRWPAATVSTDSDFSICVLGSDPFGATLDKIVAGELVDGRKLAIVRIENASAARNCRILFVGRSEQGRAASILSSLAHSPVLTVSDMPGFTDRGGIIEFVMQGDKVRFQVNLAAAERAGLNMSSELLKVAVAVKRES